MLKINHKNKAAHRNFIIFIFPLIFTLASFALYNLFQPTYEMFAASLLAYWIKVVYTVLTLICSFLCLFISVKLFKKNFFPHSIIYFVFSLFLAFLFLELIHYGQKIYSPLTSEYPLALHEIPRLRGLFDSAFFFIGVYSSFYWIRFVNNPRPLKSGVARLFVPDGRLFLYFFPIVIFFLIAILIEHITHQAINGDCTSVIKNFLWLFDLNRFFPHFSRPLLAVGLLVFFCRNAIWINQKEALRNVKAKFAFTDILILLVVLFIMTIGFAVGGRNFQSLADLGWGKYFEINNDLNGAIHHYNVCIKRNDNASAHKELFLLYYRMGYDDPAIKHLSLAIQKSVDAGNQKMAAELYKTAFDFYPNSTVDPETRVIYFQR